MPSLAAAASDRAAQNQKTEVALADRRRAKHISYNTQ
jgi:hypothetical protein